MMSASMNKLSKRSSRGSQYEKEEFKDIDEGMRPAPPVKCGWLHKRAQGLSKFGKMNWKKRWFTLHIGFLRYFEKAESTQNSKGTIIVPSIRAVEKCNSAFGKSHLFQVVYENTPNSFAVLYCQAENADDQAEWIETIQRLCTNNVGKMNPRYHPGYASKGVYTCCNREEAQSFFGCETAHAYIDTSSVSVDDVAAEVAGVENEEESDSHTESNRSSVVDLSVRTSVRHPNTMDMFDALLDVATPIEVVSTQPIKITTRVGSAPGGLGVHSTLPSTSTPTPTFSTTTTATPTFATPTITTTATSTSRRPINDGPDTNQPQLFNPQTQPQIETERETGGGVAVEEGTSTNTTTVDHEGIPLTHDGDNVKNMEEATRLATATVFKNTTTNTNTTDTNTTDTNTTDTDTTSSDEWTHVTLSSYTPPPGRGVLGFDKGEQLRIMEKKPTGWWWAKKRIDNKQGWVPESYVHPIQNAGDHSSQNLGEYMDVGGEITADKTSTTTTATGDTHTGKQDPPKEISTDPLWLETTTRRQESWLNAVAQALSDEVENNEAGALHRGDENDKQTSNKKEISNNKHTDDDDDDDDDTNNNNDEDDDDDDNNNNSKHNTNNNDNENNNKGDTDVDVVVDKDTDDAVLMDAVMNALQGEGYGDDVTTTQPTDTNTNNNNTTNNNNKNNSTNNNTTKNNTTTATTNTTTTAASSTTSMRKNKKGPASPHTSGKNPNRSHSSPKSSSKHTAHINTPPKSKASPRASPKASPKAIKKVVTPVGTTRLKSQGKIKTARLSQGKKPRGMPAKRASNKKLPSIPTGISMLIGDSPSSSPTSSPTKGSNNTNDHDHTTLTMPMSMPMGDNHDHAHDDDDDDNDEEGVQADNAAMCNYVLQSNISLLEVNVAHVKRSIVKLKKLSLSPPRTTPTTISSTTPSSLTTTTTAVSSTTTTPPPTTDSPTIKDKDPHVNLHDQIEILQRNVNLVRSTLIRLRKQQRNSGGGGGGGGASTFSRSSSQHSSGKIVGTFHQQGSRKAKKKLAVELLFADDEDC